MNYKASEVWEHGNTLGTMSWLSEYLVKNDVPVLEYHAGDLILESGCDNDALYIIKSGTVELSKSNKIGQRVIIDELRVGSFLGMISFWTSQKTLACSRAIDSVTCFRLNKKLFLELIDQDSSFYHAVWVLTTESLTDRYRNVVHLNLDIAALTQKLSEQKLALQDSIDTLQKTREQYVSRERHAVMGELMAGIAHEINNPCSSLLHSVTALSKSLVPENSSLSEVWNEGFLGDVKSTADVRSSIKLLESNYPNLPRPTLRKLASINDETLSVLLKDIPLGKKSPNKLPEPLLLKLNSIEQAKHLRVIEKSSERISTIVQSIKSYGRKSSDNWEMIDLRKNIQDTLIILNNKLKHRNVALQLNSIPSIRANAGEINQILTNLLVNALEATKENDSILVRCFTNNDKISIQIEDSGKGIAVDSLEKIFENNFTTKNSGTGFGLGLGLSLSRDIAEKHNGCLTASNRAEGGASFTLTLPVS